MKLSSRQLDGHLRSGLAHAYLVSGDEPLIVSEAAQRIRAAARERGFEERDLHVVERGFKWAELAGQTDNLSLFASRRITELRLPSARPGEEGGREIAALAERRDDDRLLLVVCGKLDGAASRSVWVRSFEQHGVHVQCWPVSREELPRWLQQRAKRLGLELDGEAAGLLAERTEGHLLAGAQELEKLALARGPGRVDADAVLESVASNARFDVFRLTDAVLSGEPARALAVLEGLRSEGAEPVLVCWALSRELALLAKLKFAIEQGESVERALSQARVWSRRQPLVKQALARYRWRDLVSLLRRTADADAAVKGMGVTPPWDALTGLVMAALASDLRRATAAVPR